MCDVQERSAIAIQPEDKWREGRVLWGPLGQLADSRFKSKASIHKLSKYGFSGRLAAGAKMQFHLHRIPKHGHSVYTPPQRPLRHATNAPNRAAVRPRAAAEVDNAPSPGPADAGAAPAAAPNQAADVVESEHVANLLVKCVDAKGVVASLAQLLYGMSCNVRPAFVVMAPSKLHFDSLLPLVFCCRSYRPTSFPTWTRDSSTSASSLTTPT